MQRCFLRNGRPMVSAAVRNLLWLPPYPQDSGNLMYMIAFFGLRVLLAG
jgi:hypothetical protein